MPQPYEKVFMGLYDTMAEKLWRHAFFRVSNRQQAEDLVSECFLRAWDSYRTKPIKDLKPLLYRILHNLIIDYYRKQKPTASIEELLERHEDVAQVDPQSISDPALPKLLNKLPTELRQILIWRYLDDLSITDIAKLAGKSSGSIYVIIHRAIKKLRDQVQQ